jgi:hypothetical protein
MGGPKGLQAADDRSCFRPDFSKSMVLFERVTFAHIKVGCVHRRFDFFGDAVFANTSKSPRQAAGYGRVSASEKSPKQFTWISDL